LLIYLPAYSFFNNSFFASSSSFSIAFLAKSGPFGGSFYPNLSAIFPPSRPKPCAILFAILINFIFY